MKNILFLLFLPFISFAQKVELDSMIVRNDSIFYVRTAKIYEHVPDTTGLHERYMQLDEIITGLEAEQDAIKERIAFFESKTFRLHRKPCKSYATCTAHKEETRPQT